MRFESFQPTADQCIFHELCSTAYVDQKSWNNYSMIGNNTMWNDMEHDSLQTAGIYELGLNRQTDTQTDR